VVGYTGYKVVSGWVYNYNMLFAASQISSQMNRTLYQAPQEDLYQKNICVDHSLDHPAIPLLAGTWPVFQKSRETSRG